MAITLSYRVFRTSSHIYAYDGGTNRIVRITPLVARILELCAAEASNTVDVNKDWLLSHLGPELDIDHAAVRVAIDRYLEHRRHGLFGVSMPRQFLGEGHARAVVEDPQLAQLILEVTEQCNMRCRYCAYSEWYPRSREYSNRYMSWTTARKAIDYFMAHSTREMPAVTFYGGEPLLAMGLIERCCIHARRVAGNRPLRFQLTTNGTRLDTVTVARLSALDVHILVSLDGDAANHDVNRVTKGQHPTHGRIVEHVKAIRRDHYDYFKNNVSYVSTLGSNVSPHAAFKFFEAHDRELGGLIHIVSLVSSKGSDYWTKQPPTEQWKREMLLLRMLYYRSILRMDPARSKFLDALFQAPFVKLYKRQVHRGASKLMNMNGCCVPGMRRLFVAVDGAFYTCERTERYAPIGDVNRGIDPAKVRRLCKTYAEARQQRCSQCWMQRLCGDCFATSSVGAGETANEEKACDLSRAAMERILIDYCQIVERNPFAWRFFDGIVVK